MKPLISEFSYGYALTEELAAGWRGVLRGAPVFPSLIDEGNVGGYDMELPILGVPLFLQFKLSHYLKRSSALDWSHWYRPYFRMYLRPLRHSRQHSLLLAWERRGNEVYYATPTFHEAPELNEAYSARRVVQSSVFFRPRDIGPLRDMGQHYIVFHPSDPTAFFHSAEPRPIQSIPGATWHEKVVFSAQSRMKEITPGMLGGLLESIEVILSKEMPSWQTQRHVLFERFIGHELRGVAAYVSYLARTYFDSQFILLSPWEENTPSAQPPQPYR